MDLPSDSWSPQELVKSYFVLRFTLKSGTEIIMGRSTKPKVDYISPANGINKVPA